MHFIRRAALRAASSPSASIVSKQRSITTTSPFALRSKIQSGVSSSVFRRFASDEASEQKSDNNHVESADGEKGAVKQAIDSVASYASDAAESLTSNAGQAKDTITDAAAAAGIAYQPREDRRQYGGRGGDRGDRGYGGDRGGRGGYQGDRGNGERRPYGGDRGGFAERGPRAPRPDRIIVPSNGIYVGNLLFDITSADLEKEFKEFGTIRNVTVASDARGLSKGFGYVEFETIESANAAIAAKHQSVMEGRRLIVNYQSKSTRSAVQNPPSKTLFIGNLAFEMSDADLNKLFRDIRNVIDVRVAIDRRTGQPRGFAHADFVDVESAQKARDLLSGKDVYGRPLRVDFSATPTDNRPPRDNFPRDD